MKTKIPVVALISGRGSNLQAIIDASKENLPIIIRAAISNRYGAYGLERAARAGIKTETLRQDEFTTRESFDRALIARIDAYQPELVILAGFMRILSEEFVAHYRGRLLNIHPSLLPLLPGLDTHQRALDAGMSEHGATIHFVTEEVDAGPIVVQARVPILPDDTADGLAARVLEQEHRIYPQAIRWFAEGRLQLEGSRALLDGKPAMEAG